MGKLVCDVCGGKIVMQSGGEYGECENCGTGYSLERMKEIATGIKVSVTGTQEDVDQWKALVETYIKTGDFASVEVTIKKILDAIPNDDFANNIYQKLQDWKYYDIRNGVLVKYNGHAIETEIPFGVTQIADAKIYDNTINDYVGVFGAARSTLKRIHIPDSVTYIGDNAFKYCSLESYNIPENIRHIGAYAFAHNECNMPIKIVFPNTLKSLGLLAFWGNQSIADVSIPSSIKGIEHGVFAACYNLYRLQISEGVEEICEQAFSDCKKLESITIPKSVISIMGFAFGGCENLYDINIIGMPNIDGCAFSRTKYQENIDERNWRRYKGLCQYCGGNISMWSSKCKICGKTKDY